MPKRRLHNRLDTQFIIYIQMEIHSKDCVGGWTLSLMAQNEEEKTFLINLEIQIKNLVQATISKEFNNRIRLKRGNSLKVGV